MTISFTSEQIAIDRIKIDKDREPDEENVAKLMGSIVDLGVLQPIVLSRASPGLGIKLIFGRDRLEACKRLKLRSTLARVVNGDSAEIRSWIERAIVAENLIRKHA